jgi:hypothetical protein
MKLSDQEGQVMNTTWPDSATGSVTHTQKETLHGRPWRSSSRLSRYFLISTTNTFVIVFLCSPSFRKSRDEISFKRGRVVTPRVMKILIKLLKMQLSLKARANQAVEVADQNLNYQDFKFDVSKCCLVWTDILSQQILRIYWIQITPWSQKRNCSSWIVIQVCKCKKKLRRSESICLEGPNRAN